MAKTPFDENMWVAYPEVNPTAKSLWERYKVDPSEIENYKYYGFGEQDVRDRIQENYKRYGMNPHSYSAFEEAMGDLIADIEYAHPDLYEKRWGMKHPAFDEDGIEEDYLKDLAKVRAKHRGGDINLAEKELRDLYGSVIIPKQSRTLGDVMEEKAAAKKQAKYNEKNLKKANPAPKGKQIDVDEWEYDDVDDDYERSYGPVNTPDKYKQYQEWKANGDSFNK